jgi:methyl-accepting chemotaxis protein
VWIQASYTPILDLKGKPIKVVEYATVIESVAAGSEEASLSIQETPVSLANQAADDITSESVEPSLSMRRLEASRKNASAGPSLFSNLLTNLRDGLSNALVSSTRAVTNFL